MRKTSKEIKFNKSKIGEISFLPSDYYIESINKQILKSVKKLKDFYDTNIPYIKIELIYSRKELNNKIKRKTPNWLIGFAYKNKIYSY